MTTKRGRFSVVTVPDTAATPTAHPPRGPPDGAPGSPLLPDRRLSGSPPSVSVASGTVADDHGAEIQESWPKQPSHSPPLVPAPLPTATVVEQVVSPAEVSKQEPLPHPPAAAAARAPIPSVPLPRPAAPDVAVECGPERPSPVELLDGTRGLNTGTHIAGLVVSEAALAETRPLQLGRKSEPSRVPAPSAASGSEPHSPGLGDEPDPITQPVEESKTQQRCSSSTAAPLSSNVQAEGVSPIFALRGVSASALPEPQMPHDDNKDDDRDSNSEREHDDEEELVQERRDERREQHIGHLLDLFKPVPPEMPDEIQPAADTARVLSAESPSGLSVSRRGRLPPSPVTAPSAQVVRRRPTADTASLSSSKESPNVVRRLQDPVVAVPTFSYDQTAYGNYREKLAQQVSDYTRSQGIRESDIAFLPESFRTRNAGVPHHRTGLQQLRDFFLHPKELPRGLSLRSADSSGGLPAPPLVLSGDGPPGRSASTTSGVPSEDYGQDLEQGGKMSETRIFRLQLSTGSFLIVLGIVAAVTEYAMDLIQEQFNDVRQRISDSNLAFGARYTLFSLFTLFMALIAYFITQRISPVAQGSGIPALKAILSGTNIENYLAFRTLIAKMFGFIFARGAGLIIGKEGPFVHIACILSEQLLRFSVFRHLTESRAIRQQILACAAAVGVAATFRAPIGGLLFSVEVTAISYLVVNYWKGFFTASVGMVAVYLISSEGDFLFLPTALGPTALNEFVFTKAEVVAFALLGLAGGLFGSLFVMSFKRLVSLRRWAERRGGVFAAATSPIVFLSVVSLGTALVVFPLGNFRRLGISEGIDDLFSSQSLANPTNPGLLNADDWNRNGQLELNLFLYGCITAIFAVLSMTLPVPLGLYLPLVSWGAVWGRLMGQGMVQIFPNLGTLPAVYAVAGAAAFAAGTTRTLSTAVIIFEMTGEITLAIPVIIVVTVAIFVGNHFTLGLYDASLLAQKLPYLPAIRLDKTMRMVTRDIMDPNPRWLPKSTSVGQILQVLRQSNQSESTLIALVDSVENRLIVASVAAKDMEAYILTLYRQYVRSQQRKEQRKKFRAASAEASRQKESSAERASDSKVSFAIADGRGQLHTYKPRESNPSLGPSEPAAATTTWMNQFSVKSFQHFMQRLRNVQHMGFMSGGREPTLNEITDDVLLKIDRKVDLFAVQELRLNAAPYQIVEQAPITDLVFLFSMLHCQETFVTAFGQLSGVVTKTHLARSVDQINEQDTSRPMQWLTSRPWAGSQVSFSAKAKSAANTLPGTPTPPTHEAAGHSAVDKLRAQMLRHIQQNPEQSETEQLEQLRQLNREKRQERLSREDTWEFDGAMATPQSRFVQLPPSPHGLRRKPRFTQAIVAEEPVSASPSDSLAPSASLGSPERHGPVHENSGIRLNEV